MKSETTLEYLLQNDDLERLIELTKNSSDNPSRFYYLLALRKLGENNIMLSYISENQMELYNYDAPNLIRLHIEALVDIRAFDQALNVLKQYENFPYFSMETNETISELGEMVQKKRKERTMIREYTIHELERRLSSNNEDLIMSAIEYMNNNFHETYVPLIEKYLKQSKDELSKGMLFVTLKEHHYDKPVTIVKFNQPLRLNPRLVHTIAEDKASTEMIKKYREITREDDDVNIERLGFQTMLRHNLFLYPLSIQKKHAKELAYYFYFTVLALQGRGLDFAEFIEKYNLDKDRFSTILELYHIPEFQRTL